MVKAWTMTSIISPGSMIVVNPTKFWTAKSGMTIGVSFARASRKLFLILEQQIGVCVAKRYPGTVFCYYASP